MPVKASASHLACVRFEETVSFSKFSVGEGAVDSDGGHWRFVKASEDIAAFDAVKIDDDYGIARLTTTIAGTEPTNVGIAQVAFKSGEYGWVFEGPGGGIGKGIKVNVLVSCAADAKLYTTATAGKLDDTSTKVVQNIKIVTAEPGVGTAAIECYATGLLTINGET